MPASPFTLTISERYRAYTQHQSDPVTFVQDSLDRIEGENPFFRSFVYTDRTNALAHAAASAARWREGRPKGPLDGMTFAIKDNMVCAGMPTFAGSQIKLGLTPKSQVFVSRLQRAGAILLGKLNMDECAFGISTQNPSWGNCLNPLDTARSPGGSSGGSAAAVAAGLCQFAFGTDTMGSIRMPAAYCGTWGYKPSWNAASLKGVVPLCTSLDSVGPLSRSLADLCAAYEVFAHQKILPADRDVIRVGVAGLSPLFQLDEAHQQGLQTLLKRLSAQGHHVMDVELPEWDPEADRRQALLLTVVAGARVWSEFTTNDLGRLSPALQRAFDYGTTVSAEKIQLATGRQRALKRASHRWFQDVDLILMPVTPTVAPLQSEPVASHTAQACCLANLTGCPAISFPVKTPLTHLPAGFQLVGPRGRDAHLLALASKLQSQGIFG